LAAIGTFGGWITCPNGDPFFELDFQGVLATLGLDAAALMWIFIKRRSYRLATVALVAGLLLYGGWACSSTPRHTAGTI